MSSGDAASGPNFFEGIPKEASPICTPQFPPANLVLSSTDGGSSSSSSIEIGEASQVFPNRNALLVGRQAATCDIRITHKSLSRQHALLYYCTPSNDDEDDDAPRIQLYIFDLDTKSGTFVNQQRIAGKTPVMLKNGDAVQFGKAQPSFTVQWKDDSSENGNDKGKQEESQGVTTIASSREEPVVDPFEGLTGRERRQAEIAAMMASLDQTPTYSKFTPTGTEEQPFNGNAIEDGNSDTILDPQRQTRMEKKKKTIEKHHLPLTEYTDMATLETSHISSVVMDPTGARFAIGSMDSSLKLYDFAGFNVNDPIPFQNIIIEDGYPIRSMSYSSTGDRLVVATGSPQPVVVDRDGQEIIKFVRGDMYVRDPQKTIGHTAPVTSVGWHPLEKSIVFTTSRDGSLRTWNVDKGSTSFEMLKCSDVVIIKNLKSGRKTTPTCLAVAPGTLAMGTECGSLQIYIFPLVSKLRPQQSVRVVPAEEPDEPVVSVIYSVDASKIATRTKNIITVWNTAGRLSSSSLPWMTCEDVYLDDIDNSTPTMSFSPNGKLLCVATSSMDEQSKLFTNKILVFAVPKEAKSKPSTPIFAIPIRDRDETTGIKFPISGLLWHVKLNQILVTTTQGFQVWYSTEWSKKGILLTSGRPKKRQAEESLQELYESRAPPPGSAVREEAIITPNALPLFGGDQRKSKKQRGEEEHQEAMAKHIPQKPGKGVYNTANTQFTQMIMDDRTATKRRIAGMDPREALAQYNEGKSYIGTAYEGNVERILTDKTVEEEEDDMKKKSKK